TDRHTTPPCSLAEQKRQIGRKCTICLDTMTLVTNTFSTMSFNSSAELTCSVSSGSSFSYLWMNGSSEVSATGRLQLTDGGSTLTVVNVTRYDQGPFRCCVFNPVSNSSSDSVNFTISLPISNVTLWAKETNLVEYNDTAVLMCSVSNGSSLSFEWLDGNSTVTAGGQVLLSNGNATLTILNVTHHYQGPFRCKVSNGISHEISAPVHLNISYGPSNTTMMITPMKDTYKTGSKITLSCSAESSPPAMIKWIVDGVYLNQSGPQLQLENVTQGNSGHYTCVLHNTVTSRFSSASPDWFLE
uniref:Ig-like domain-containing protein n=1 Tax=Amphiprion ocellaris TaxID=80972 RepID=A0AAQ5YFR3_AMPOC